MTEGPTAEMMMSDGLVGGYMAGTPPWATARVIAVKMASMTPTKSREIHSASPPIDSHTASSRLPPTSPTSAARYDMISSPSSTSRRRPKALAKT